MCEAKQRWKTKQRPSRFRARPSGTVPDTSDETLSKLLQLQQYNVMEEEILGDLGAGDEEFGSTLQKILADPDDVMEEILSDSETGGEEFWKNIDDVTEEQILSDSETGDEILGEPEDVTNQEDPSNPEPELKDPAEEPGDGTTDIEPEPERPAQSNNGNIAADVGKITAIVEGANMVEGATMEEE